MRITFQDMSRLQAFCGMAEGMEEVARDDEDSDRGDALLALCGAIHDALPMVSDSESFSVTLPESFADIAADVAENCLDCSSGTMTGNDSDVSWLFPGEVTIEREATSMRVRAAVEIALARLRKKGDTDSAVLTAIGTLQALLDQAGCEHLGGEGVETLCEVCDIVIFG